MPIVQSVGGLKPFGMGSDVQDGADKLDGASRGGGGGDGQGAPRYICSFAFADKERIEKVKACLEANGDGVHMINHNEDWKAEWASRAASGRTAVLVFETANRGSWSDAESAFVKQRNLAHVYISDLALNTWPAQRVAAAIVKADVFNPRTASAPNGDWEIGVSSVEFLASGKVPMAVGPSTAVVPANKMALDMMLQEHRARNS